MIQVGDDVAAAASSSVCQTSNNTQMWVRISGDATSTAMMESLDNSTFAAFTTGGAAITFTASGYTMFDVPGGVYFRFDVTGGTGTDIHVSGPGVQLTV